MRTNRSRACRQPFRIRAGRTGDVEALVDLVTRTFTTDRVSRRGFCRFLDSPHSDLLVAAQGRTLLGYAIVRFAPRVRSARLYSISVAPHMRGRGVAPLLMTAAEEAALRRGRTVLRLEVHEYNARAIRRYEKSGYRPFGRYTDYYEDHGDALRFEKGLTS